MKQMNNGREELMNIFSYVDFANLCNVIKHFPELNLNFVKEGITFPLSYSLRAIKWKNNYL